MEEIEKKKKHLGTISLIIGIVSLVLFCAQLGYLGIIGIIIGIVSIKKKETKKAGL